METERTLKNLNNYLNANSNANAGINRDRQSVGNEHDNKGSPRLGRLRGISPQSREKAYMSGSGGNASGQPSNASNLNYSNN